MWCARLFRRDTPHYRERILRSFRLHDAFREIISGVSSHGPFVIISRNYLDFVETFGDMYADMFREHGLMLVGAIGQMPPSFKFSSREKTLFLPEGSTFIGDCFEHAVLRSYTGYYNVHPRPYVRTILAKVKKGVYVVRNMFRRS